jgi:hypothetical protein
MIHEDLSGLVARGARVVQVNARAWNVNARVRGAREVAAVMRRTDPLIGLACSGGTWSQNSKADNSKPAALPVRLGWRHGTETDAEDAEAFGGAEGGLARDGGGDQDGLAACDGLGSKRRFGVGELAGAGEHD